MTTEEWRDVDGYEGSYQVSSWGRVFSTRKRKCLKPWLSKGYPQVGLWDGSRQHNKCIHRVVAEAFLPNPEAKPQVNHIDGVPTNNRVDNLEWATLSENAQHAYSTGLNSSVGVKNSQAKLTSTDVEIIRELRKEGLLYREIAKMFGVTPTTIGLVVRGVRWAHV